MDTQRLYEILRETTVQLKKGPEVQKKKVGNIQVTEVFLMPDQSQAPDTMEKVDMHFIIIGVDKAKAKKHKDELLKILNDWPSEAYGQPVPKLQDGPSYIHVGGIIGDQGSAFQLFALGQVLGFWQVVTPEKLGFRGDEAREMAGGGLVMIDGFRA